MAYLQPLSAEASPELSDIFAQFESILGFVPNSLLTMQRRPAIVRAFGQLTAAVMDPQGAVDPGFKRLLAHFASRAAGCQYCAAHSLLAAGISGVEDKRLEAIWDYQASPLFSEAERAAFDFALAAGSVPNAVDEELMDRLKSGWSEEQIVELLAAVCLYGFLNRWNDAMATDLEDVPKELGDRLLTRGGWTGGKHVKSTGDT